MPNATTTTTTPFDPAVMDAAAAVAKKEFEKLPADVREAMSSFWGKHYIKAGHKRLGRMLAAIDKANKKGSEAPAEAPAKRVVKKAAPVEAPVKKAPAGKGKAATKSKKK